MSRRTAPVTVITDARTGLSEDVHGRTRRYLVMMAVRTVCFGLAVVTDGWVRWAFVVGAVLLPYVSVVLANGGREPTKQQEFPAVAPPLAALPGPTQKHTYPGVEI